MARSVLHDIHVEDKSGIVGLACGRVYSMTEETKLNIVNAPSASILTRKAMAPE